MKIFNVLRAVMLAVILSSAAFANASENISISDMAGRKVIIPSKVTKIAAVTGALRLAVYLDCVDMIAGIENLEIRFPADTGRPYSLALAGKVDDDLAGSAARPGSGRGRRPPPASARQGWPGFRAPPRRRG